MDDSRRCECSSSRKSQPHRINCPLPFDEPPPPTEATVSSSMNCRKPPPPGPTDIGNGLLHSPPNVRPRTQASLSLSLLLSETCKRTACLLSSVSTIGEASRHARRACSLSAAKFVDVHSRSKISGHFYLFNIRYHRGDNAIIRNIHSSRMQL